MKRNQSQDTYNENAEEALWQRFREEIKDRADGNKPSTVPLRTMVGFSLDEMENAAFDLSADQGECGTDIDTAALKRRIFIALERKQRVNRSVKWMSAAAASLAVVAALGVVSDASRFAHVVENVVIPGERNTLFYYEVDGVPLNALPEGYGPHYIPERFVSEEILADESWMRFTVYRTKDNKQSVDISIQVLSNASASRGDNEHTTYRTLDFGDADAYLGTWDTTGDAAGHSLQWVSKGMEHFIYGNVSEEEIMEMARNIY